METHEAAEGGPSPCHGGFLAQKGDISGGRVSRAGLRLTNGSMSHYDSKFGPMPTITGGKLHLKTKQQQNQDPERR